MPYLRQEAQDLISTWLNGCKPSPVIDHTPDIDDDDSQSVISDGTPTHSSNTSNFSIEEIQQNSGPRERRLDMGLSEANIKTYGMLISRSARNAITVTEVQDHITIPEYPHTSSTGIAHFLHMPRLKGRQNPFKDREEVLQQFAYITSKIQFGLKQVGTVRQSQLACLGNVGSKPAQAWHMSTTCSGVKHCEYVSPDKLRPCEAYSRVELSTLNDLRKQTSRLYYPIDLAATVKRQTELFYQAYLQDWRQNSSPCTNPSTKERCCEGVELSMFIRRGVWHVGCPFSTNSEPWHKASTVIQNSATCDIRYLKALVTYGFNGQQATCALIEQQTIRRQLCGFDHPQGQGRVITCTCSASLDIFIPINIARFPFYVLAARAEHMHHPPYPTKLPRETAEEVQELLQGLDLLTLTPRRLLLSENLRQFLALNNATSLAQIHGSLNCQDRIAALIKKQRLLRYPQGRDLAGVIREAAIDSNKELDEQWVRKVEVFEDFFVIICFHLRQAQAFHTLRTCQMDLSFKAIRGPTNCFSIVAFDEEEQRNQVYLRAYINRDTREAYFHMFQLLFQAVEDATKEKVKWHHIHTNQGGIQAVVVDMCKKQAGGFGDYLHALQPEREWHEHLQHMLIFCDVHIRRNLRKRFPKHPLLDTLRGLFDVRDRDDLVERMRSICDAHPELTHWIRNKQTPWILSGLCKWVSKVDSKVFEITQRNTNLSESSHYMDNEFTGRGLSLLGAIIGHKHVDLQRFNRADFTKDTGIQDTWRNKSFINRLIQSTKKQGKYQQLLAEKRRRNPRRPADPFNAYDVETAAHAEHRSDISEVESVSIHSEATSDAQPSSIASSSYRTAYVEHVSDARSSEMPPPKTPTSRKRTRGRTLQIDLENIQKERDLVGQQLTILRQKMLLQKEQKELEELQKVAKESGISTE